jgi:hypothetical protein
MSVPHTDAEKERESAPQAAYARETIQGQAAPAGQPPPPSFRPTGRRGFMVAIVSIVVVLLLALSAGVIALVQLGQQHVSPGTPTPNPTATTAATTTQVPTSTTQPTVTPTLPPTGQWVQLLTGYRVTSLAAAPSYPNVLYACAIPPGFPVEYRSVQTVLRSADFGTHWQDIGSRAQMSRDCELTINPTDSYEIYVATSSSPPADQAVPSYVLEHTSNGGDTWETIHPVVFSPGRNAALAWQGTQLSFAGNRLYSLQAIPASLTPTPQGNQGLTRLVMSSDGGHTWSVLDTQLAAAARTAQSYAVLPANPATFYELAFLPGIPGGPLPSLELYQSADGGLVWHQVLKGIAYSMTPREILTGSENLHVVYLTNSRCPASQALHAGGGPLARPFAGSPFSLCLSSDAGKSWNTLTPPGQFASTMGGGVIDQQGRLYTQATISSSLEEIWRYDPVTATWSKVTQAPRDGTLLAGTSTGANGATVLWLMSTSGQAALYRYVV